MIRYIHYCQHNLVLLECGDCSPKPAQHDAFARGSDPDTSHEAAASVDVNALEAIVLDALERDPDGMTAHEIADLTGEALVSISPRMKPLEGKALIERTTERRGRRTVWRLASGRQQWTSTA